MKNDIEKYERGKIHLYPMVRIALLLIIGIVVMDYCGVIETWYLLVILAITIIGASLAMNKSALLSSLFVMAGIVTLGSIRYNEEMKDMPEMPNEMVRVEEELLVIKQPVEHGKVLQFDAYVYSEGQCAKRKVMVSMLRDTIEGRYKNVKIGDALKVKGDLSAFEEWHKTNSHFSYLRWLRGRGFVGRLFVPIKGWDKTIPDWQKIGIWERTKVRLLEIRQTVVEKMRTSGMTEEAIGISVAMALGDKQGLTKEMREEFSEAGVSHVLALSGMHLGIVFAILSLLIGKRNRLQQTLLLTVIWLYVMFAGMPISLIRAAMMLTIWRLLSWVDIEQKPMNILGAVATIMILLNPNCLWDVGFQMSFMAVASIFIVVPAFEEFMPDSFTYKGVADAKGADIGHKYKLSERDRAMLWLKTQVWSLVMMSTAAQIGTYPLSAYYFGRVSLLFLITNAIVIPLTAVVLFFMFIMLITCLIDIVASGSMSLAIDITGKATEGAIYLLNSSQRLIGSLSVSSIENIDINGMQVVMLYIVTGGTMFIVWKMMKILIRR